MPTRRFGSLDFGILSKMCASSPGASLDAHPAHFTVAVKRIFCCVIIELSVVGCQLSVKRFPVTIYSHLEYVKGCVNCESLLLVVTVDPPKQISRTPRSVHLDGTGRRRGYPQSPDSRRSQHPAPPRSQSGSQFHHRAVGSGRR